MYGNLNILVKMKFILNVVGRMMITVTLMMEVRRKSPVQIIPIHSHLVNLHINSHNNNGVD